MATFCFYHRADLDGRCSGAIVKHVNGDAKMMPMDYNDPFPWEQIDPNDTVYMVDVSMPPGDMARLAKASTFIWIDHHQTAIAAIDKGIDGLRRVGAAGCELTWEYLYGDKDVPRGVKLLGRYDVWDHTDQKLWDEQIMPFQMGVKAQNTSPDNQAFWSKLFESSDEFIEKVMTVGGGVHSFQKESHKVAGERTIFEGTFAGHKAVFSNNVGGSSDAFAGFFDPKKHAIMVGFYMNNQRKWIVSLRSTSNLDVSALAKARGGGGHQQAAGFTANDLSFIDS